MSQNKSKSVSECCKCPVYKEGYVTSYWVCEKCGKACDISTTNPSKEPADHIGYLNEKTDSKPTVEKKQYEIKCYKCGHLLRTYTVPYYYDDEMEQECYCYNCFSHSVQEAKAEILQKIDLIRARHKDEHICRFNDGECDCDCYLEGLDRVKRQLASLKQEEKV